MTPSSIRVTVGDVAIDHLSNGAILQGMNIAHEINQHSTCFLEYRQTPDLPFDLTGIQGMALLVFAVLSDGTEFPIFEGTVESSVQKYLLSGAFHLQIFGSGLTLDLDQQNRFRTFKMSGFAEKMKKIVDDGAIGVEAAVVVNDTDSIAAFPRNYQLGETDWDHLLAEAGDLGLMVFPDGEKLFAMDHFQPSPTTLQWRAEAGLIGFEVRTQHFCAARRGVNYDRGENQSKVFSGVTDDVPRLGAFDGLCDHMKKMNSLDAVQGGQHDVTLLAESIAEGDLKRESRRALGMSIRGVGESREAALLVGRTVEIQGDTQFAGKWGVLRVTHHFTDGGYRNEFEVTPYDTGVCVPQLSNPRAFSDFRARVTSAPVRETGRIRIQFPWEEEDEALFWPWMAPHGGADRGFCFPPEIGDEVLVHFQNGDAREAYIVSSAWNDKELPPLEDLHGNEVDNNDIKRIVTKSGNRLVMDDKDGKETIVMATPNHVRVSLFDGGSTLLLHSDGDIHIKAGGTLHVKCNQFLREVG